MHSLAEAERRMADAAQIERQQREVEASQTQLKFQEQAGEREKRKAAEEQERAALLKDMVQLESMAAEMRLLKVATAGPYMSMPAVHSFWHEWTMSQSHTAVSHPQLCTLTWIWDMGALTNMGCLRKSMLLIGL